MSVRRFLGSVIAATLAALAAAPRLIWEGGRWILRSLAPPQQAQQAESALVAQVEDLVAETEAKAEMTAAGGITRADVCPTHYTDLGRAALQYLQPMEGDDPTLAVMLSDETKHYLDTLPRDRLALFVNFRPEQIGRHLGGDVPLLRMPKVPSYREYTHALYERMEAKGLRPDPRIVQTVRRADVDEEPQDAVRFGMR